MHIHHHALKIIPYPFYIRYLQTHIQHPVHKIPLFLNQYFFKCIFITLFRYSIIFHFSVLFEYFRVLGCFFNAGLYSGLDNKKICMMVSLQHFFILYDLIVYGDHQHQDGCDILVQLNQLEHLPFLVTLI